RDTWPAMGKLATYVAPTASRWGAAATRRSDVSRDMARHGEARDLRRSYGGWWVMAGAGISYAANGRLSLQRNPVGTKNAPHGKRPLRAEERPAYARRTGLPGDVRHAGSATVVREPGGCNGG